MTAHKHVQSTSSPTVSRAAVTTFRVATALTIGAVALGSVVCATQSGFECGNWPGCDAHALLPHGPVSDFLYRNPWIEMIHRTSAILAGPAVLASAVIALRLKHLPRMTKVLPWLAVVGAIVSGFVGRGVVTGVHFPWWVGAADLGCALMAMWVMTTATVALERTPAVWFGTRTSRLAWSATGVLLAMHLVSLYAAGIGSYTRCLSWPVWELLSADRSGSMPLQYVRFPLAALALVLLVGAVWSSVRDAELRSTGVAVGVLTAVVVGFSVMIRLSHSTDLGMPYSLATVALLFTLVLLAARASLDKMPTASLTHDAAVDAEDARI